MVARVVVGGILVPFPLLFATLIVKALADTLKKLTG